jgi:hypothetical protein
VKFFTLALSTSLLATPLLYTTLPAGAISSAFCPTAFAGFKSLEAKKAPPGTSEMGRLQLALKTSKAATKLFTKLASMSPGAKPEAALLGLAAANKSLVAKGEAMVPIARKYEANPNDIAVKTTFRNDLTVMNGEDKVEVKLLNKVVYWLEKLCPNP